ncbi:MAG: acetyl-CoA carboxylase biotin carboxyl carrier protein subunit [Bacteroidia bacterium]|nr:acetyl-CoA carboxylase biotin carboxyl carrier protein subunit [Bacteroidia bacterium]
MNFTISFQDSTLTCSTDSNQVLINGEQVERSFKWIKKGELAFLIVNNASYRIAVSKVDRENKTVKLKINGKLMELSISDPMNELLKNLGFDKLMNKGASLVKSPMPGLVLKTLVKPGDTVRKGDSLLILEAMKMENIIKSPMDGNIKAVHVTERQAIEKNKIMVEFES